MFRGVLLLGAIAPWTASAGPVLTSSINPANGHRYFLLDASNWTDAETQAAALGGHLVTVNDAAENTWVYETFSHFSGEDRYLWIGLNDAAQSGTFVWASGEPVSYTNWDVDQPDNQGGVEHYVHLPLPGTSAAPAIAWNNIRNDHFPATNPFFGVVEIDPLSTPVLFSSLPDSGDVALSVHANQAIGVSFESLAGTALTDFVARLAYVRSSGTTPSVQLRVEIWSSKLVNISGSMRPRPDVILSSEVTAMLTDNGALAFRDIAVSFATPPQLLPGRTYWIILRPTWSEDGPHVRWAASVPFSGYGHSLRMLSISANSISPDGDNIDPGNFAAFAVSTKAPLVITDPVTALIADSVSLTGAVNPNGVDTHAFFEFDTDPTFATIIATTPQEIGSGYQRVAAMAGITGLAPSTTYYARIVAGNTTATIVGNVVAFTTRAPLAVTIPADQLTTTTATLRGNIDPNGWRTMSSFVYGTSAAYGQTMIFIESPADDLETPFDFSRVLSGLSPHTTYHFAAAINYNRGSMATGPDAIFTTLNTNPVATTDNAATAYRTPAPIDVLDNDFDSDGDALTIATTESGMHGTTRIVTGTDGSQRIEYMPSIGFSGRDTFTYTISDGFSGSAEASVTVTVDPAPEPIRTTLYLRGMEVPLSGVGGSRVLDGARWRSFGVPSIANNGRVAFKAKLSTPQDVVAVVYMGSAEGGSETGAAQYVVAQDGDVAEGANGATFIHFKDPLLNNNGTIVFLASISAGGATLSGIWRHYDTNHAEPPALVVHDGLQPPGVEIGARWTRFISVALSDGAPGSELIAFTAKLLLGVGGVKATDDLGLWLVGADRPTLALREGQTIALRSGIKRIKAFTALRAVGGASGQGNGVTLGGVLTRVTFDDGSLAVLRILGDGNHVEVAVPGDILEGTNEAMSGFSSPTQSNDGKAAFVATLTGAAITGEVVVVESSLGVLDYVLRKGDTALPEGDTTFDSFSAVVSDNSGRATVTAGLKTDSTTRTIDRAIFSVDAASSTLIAREGSQPAGMPVGAKWTKFLSIAMPGGNSGPVFVGKLTGTRAGTPSTRTNDAGVWAVDSAGTVRLIVRTGEAFDATRKIVSLTLLNNVLGSPTQRRSITAEGEIIYRATLDDGAQAIVKVLVP